MLITITQPSSEPLHSKRERRKEARPQELLSAALTLFVEKGFAATKVEEIAARAGVSKGTLFLYFNSKEDLFKAVIRANLSEHFPVWNKEFTEFKGSTEASGITKLVTSEASNFPDVVQFYENEVMIPGQALFKKIFQRGIDNGEFKTLDTDKAVYSLVSVIFFLSMWKHSLSHCVGSSTFNPEAFLQSHVHALMHGWLRK